MNFIFIDMETGDVGSKATALTSIGAVAARLEDGKLLPPEGNEKFPRFEVLTLPGGNLAVTAKALECQGLTWADMMDPRRVSEGEGLFALDEWLTGLWGAVPSHEGDPVPPWPIWAFGSDFDRGHLGEAIYRIPYQVKKQKRRWINGLCGRDSLWACACTEARNAVALGCMERPKGDPAKEIKPGFSLDALCLHFGIGLESRALGHGALADAILGARVLEKLVRVGGRI